MHRFVPKPRQLMKLFSFLAVSSFLSLKLLLHETSLPLSSIEFLGLTRPLPSDVPPLILTWTSFFDDKTWEMFYGPLDPSCPHKCELTHDRRRLNESHALLFNIRDLDPARTKYDFPQEPRRRDQIWVAHSAEPPQHTYPHPENFPNVFNWTSFMRPDSDIPMYYEKAIERDQLRPNQRVIWMNATLPRLPVNDGNKALASWLVSNCHTHSHREAYVRKLQRFMGVDIYGQCWGRNCNIQSEPSSCLEEVRQRLFYLSFENANCSGYVTEKFWNALFWGQVPVVMGDRASLNQVAPPDSFIHVEDFESPEKLAQYLRKVSQNETLYQSFFRWRKTHVVVKDFFCELCSKLREWSGRSQSYVDFGAWFMKDECAYHQSVRTVNDLWRKIRRDIAQLF